MRIQTIRLLLGLVLLCIGGGFAATANAALATNATPDTLIKGGDPVGFTNMVRIQQIGLGTLQLGEKRFISGRVSAVKASGVGSANPLLGALIDCPGLGKSKWTTTNTTVNPTAVGVRFVATAPATSTYHCDLWGWSATSLSSLTNLLNVAADANTWISVDDTPHPGAGAWYPDGTTAWINPNSSVYVFQQSGWPTSVIWNPIGTGSSVHVMADPQIRNDDATSGTTNVTATLYVRQLDANNAVCTTVQSTATNFSFSTVKHHQKVLLDLPAVPVVMTGSCIRRFQILVNVANLGGPRLLVENSSYTAQIAWPNN